MKHDGLLGTRFVALNGRKPTTKTTKRGTPDQRGAYNLIVIDEPEWLKALKPHSLLNSKDIAELFGLLNRGRVHHLVRAGTFPEPDVRIDGVRSSVQWRVSTIRQEIERRKRKAKGE